MPEKVPKVKLGLKNLAMLPSYFDYIFVHLRQKVRLRPELNPKFLSFRPETDPESPARLTTLIRIKQQWLLDDHCCCSCAFYPPVAGQRQMLTIGRCAHFSLQ